MLDLNLYLIVSLAILIIVIIWLLIVQSKLKTDLSQEQTANQQLQIQLTAYNEKLLYYEKHEKQLVEQHQEFIDQLQDQLTNLQTQHQKQNIQLQQDKTTIATLETQLKQQHLHLEDKIKSLKENEEKLKQEFKNIASDIFDQNSKKFNEQSHQHLGNILTPMKQQIESFRKKVEDVYEKESKDRSVLQAELGTLKQLNEQLRGDAINLTNALKGSNKQQGSWGEMVLQRVLENSGLRKDHEYFIEVALKDDEQKGYRPDVIVKLPDQRDIIIDAKTSLIGYEQYLSVDDESIKLQHLNAHLRSINTHIDSLSGKNYEKLKGVNSLDFIFMFIPIESALMLALEKDTSLFDKAFKKKIVLVSPTTLLVALKAVENTWRYERQAQNIVEVAKRAERLYSKFVNFSDDLNKVGTHIQKAHDSFEDAKSKLSSGKDNLVRQVELFKEKANISPKKSIDQTLLERSIENN